MVKKNHEESHKGKHKTEARIKIYCVLMGVISFLFCFAAGSLILRYMEKEQKDMAMYTAKITASRVEMQLEKYVQISDFMASRIIAGGVSRIRMHSLKRQRHFPMKMVWSRLMSWRRTGWSPISTLCRGTRRRCR